jgi:hypothetical protein
VQKPPTAQNYGITNGGHFRTHFFADGPMGVQELKSGELVPTSLYEAQLCERLGAAPADPGTGVPPPPLPPPTMPPTKPPGDSVEFEAEALPVANSGVGTSVETDANASGGLWVALNAVNEGSWMKLTTPPIPPGTYQVQLTWKGNTTRGIARITIDDTDLGQPLDQYAPTQTYPSATLGSITFDEEEPHVFLMQVTGKNDASSRFGLSADKLTFVAQ